MYPTASPKIPSRSSPTHAACLLARTRLPPPSSNTLTSHEHWPHLPWGTYRLTETQAPLGWALPADNARHQVFTLEPQQLEHRRFGDNAVFNELSAVPVIPLTGGIGQDTLMIAGAPMCALSAAIVWLRR